MWERMTRREKEAFLTEYAETLIDIMLDAYEFDLDSIVMNHMLDDLEDYCEAEIYWEAC